MPPLCPYAPYAPLTGEFCLLWQQRGVVFNDKGVSSLATQGKLLKCLFWI